MPKLTSDERQDIYRSLFRLNLAFHGIVQRLDQLKDLLGRQDLKDMRGLAQELQTEINNLLLEQLSLIEERDWQHFGKVRIEMERRLAGKRK